MVTFVGTQDNIGDAIISLAELDYNAIEAYEAAINRIENKKYKEELESFKKDHQKHVDDLSLLLKNHNIKPPTGPTAKQWLTKGKVVVANFIGDKTILKALLSNEIDTNVGYERVKLREDLWSDGIEIIERGLKDERKHKQWLEDLQV